MTISIVVDTYPIYRHGGGYRSGDIRGGQRIFLGTRIGYGPTTGTCGSQLGTGIGRETTTDGHVKEHIVGLMEFGTVVVVFAALNIGRPHLSIIVKGRNRGGGPFQRVDIIVTRQIGATIPRSGVGVIIPIPVDVMDATHRAFVTTPSRGRVALSDFHNINLPIVRPHLGRIDSLCVKRGDQSRCGVGDFNPRRHGTVLKVNFIVRIDLSRFIARRGGLVRSDGQVVLIRDRHMIRRKRLYSRGGDERIGRRHIPVRAK